MQESDLEYISKHFIRGELRDGVGLLKWLQQLNPSVSEQSPQREPLTSWFRQFERELFINHIFIILRMQSLNVSRLHCGWSDQGSSDFITWSSWLFGMGEAVSLRSSSRVRGQ